MECDHDFFPSVLFARKRKYLVFKFIFIEVATWLKLMIVSKSFLVECWSLFCKK